MKGAAGTVVLILVAAVVLTVLVYNYYSPLESTSSQRAVTGRVATGGVADTGNLGFLESCNPNKDRCDAGLVCKLARNNIYKCLTAG